ncbi:sensor histidine kinase [Pseudocolwellia agarivorans]|uniref:sensor histidine kinase n=1 Tax=Pseudocolwellia agarivorans TaxID=1911682 RepID=UPI000987922E|nr:ATP-binding protein [Pseudocolwellia agarivorans]
MKIKNILLTTLLLFFFTLEVFITFDFIAQEKALEKTRAQVYQTIIQLQNQIGYVGLIHNFKNYMLRPSKTDYRDKALKNFSQASKQVNTLEILGTNILGKLEMPQTKSMLFAYKSRLDTLPSLIKKNVSARELDKYVQYNDIPSRDEIEAVSSQLSQALNEKSLTLLDNSTRNGFIILAALMMTLMTLVHFWLKTQQAALIKSNALNTKLKNNKTEIERSQKILLNAMQDIENEKQAASQLNEQLLNKNKEMEQFIYTVSHDLKSPLVTIGGFTNNLATELSEQLTEKQQYRFSRIIENVNNMETLLGDLLELSKIVQQAITLNDVDVKKVLNEQFLVLENPIIESKAVINVADNLHTIKANYRLFSEVILNLLSNAFKYRIPMQQLVIDIYTTQTETTTTLHIKDNGIGIDAKYHDLVFGIFERLSTKDGTGVGLTIVRTIMDKHKGKVSLESTLGEGCCFSVAFPNNVEVNEN